MQSIGRKTLSALLILLMLFSLLTPAAYALPLETKEEPKLDPSSATYAQDKAAYVKDRNAGDAPLLYGTESGHFSTSYIQGYVHEDGQFNIGTADGECLLFSYPGGETSETMIRIDSYDYWFHNYVTDVTFSADGKSCTATAVIGDVTVKQILSIIKNPNSTTENVISIQYVLENNGTASRNVGVRIMMDTMLGNNDGAPFLVNGTSVTHEREYRGSAVPQVYQAMDSLSNPNLTATGYLYYSGAEKPDKVQFACWPGVQNSPWNYEINAGKDLTGDSAVVIYFNEKALAAASSRTVVTYYGAYESEAANAYDPFPYDNNTYSQELAEICAGYAALAYQDYKHHAVQDLFYEDENSGKTDTKKYDRSKVLNDKLSADGFKDLESRNYKSPSEDSATYTLGRKKVNHNGQARDLIIVVIRGTNKDEWKGNMNVTGTGYVNQSEHDSFQNGATQIQSHLMRYLNSHTDIQNPMVLITGHSRGGAIGNLLAADLTNGRVDRIDSGSIFAYLFAVPNATTAYDTSMRNIYNFCFTDDFVPSLPLNTNWGYGKHGTTYTATADGLDVGDFLYKQAISIDCSEGLNERDSFDAASTKAVIAYVAKKWPSVYTYYNQAPGSGSSIESLYKFMHDVVAPAAMDELGAQIHLKTYTGSESSSVYTKIANFFVDGFSMRASVNDTHQMYTYYNALTEGGFAAGTSAATLNAAPTLNADPANAALEQAALETFANTEGNLDILGWDLADTTSWSGITWDEDGRVSAIDLCYKGLNGELDLSSFDCLSEADISGNNISGLILPDASTSVLTQLDCGYNKLTTLDILGQPLEMLICSNNYLDGEAMEEAAASILFSSCGSQNPTVDIPFSSADVAALKDKVLTNSDLWDTSAEPDSWFGVTWENFDGEYRVTRLDIANCGLSGKLDVSDLSELKSLNCSGNLLTFIEASNCDKLTFLNCNNNQITDINLSVASTLYMLSASDNCLDDKSSAALKADNINLGHQYVNAPVSSFCEAEYTVLSPIAEALGEDVTAPGTWSFVTWTAQEERYHASGLDLAHQQSLSGTLDLSTFEYLEKINCAGTHFDTLILPDKLKTLDERAFFGCSDLTRVTFPSELQSVGARAFDSCLGLQHLYFPNTLQSIGNAAFRLCANLRAAYFTGDAPECGGNAFMYTSVAFTVYHLEGTSGWDNEVWDSYIVDVVDLFSIKTYPDKTAYYVNEELDLTGLVLLKLNPNGTFEEISSGYTVTCDDMTTPGEKTVTVTHNGDSLSFTILVTHPKITDYIIYLEYENADYTGTALEPKVFIETYDGTFLTEDVDYTVTYRNNTEPGYAEVEVSGINNYTGTVVFNFQILLRKEITVTDWRQLESDHDYADNCEITWIYHAVNDDTQHMAITFDPNTMMENGYDRLHIYDEYGNTVGIYSGSQLAGRTIYVSGQTLRIVLRTDPSSTFWGFKVTNLEEKNTPAPAATITRLYGTDRIATSLAIANELKHTMGVYEFSHIIVASALNFPDALTGSYLAATLNAPILLTYEAVHPQILEYIANNLSSHGRVYILGGTSAVDEHFENALVEMDVTVYRLAGTDRLGTNLEILGEAGIYNNQPILICTAYGFADSLSASAAGLPILLVGSSLTQQQKEFLETTSGEFIIIGGQSAVSAAVEQELRAIGSVERLSGSGRYETSVLVAERFFDEPYTAVLAYARNYPDGLCGGPLAYMLGAPLILTDTYAPSAADDYIDGMTTGYVTGGHSLIDDATVNAIFDIS